MKINEIGPRGGPRLALSQGRKEEAPRLLRKGTLIILASLFLTNCGPGVNEGYTSRRNPYSTGHTNENGIEYNHGGEERMEKALKEDDFKASTQPAPQPAPTAKPLRERLKEFEIKRFDKGSNEPSRFGADRFAIRFFLIGGDTVDFNGKFQGSKGDLKVDVTASGYRLAGKINDETKQSKGEFTLSKDGETAQIFYWAYRAKLNVREDEDNKAKPGSGFESQLKELRENSFGWVHNWSVVKGPAFFIVDVVHTSGPENTAPSQPIPMFSIKGESLTTGEEMFPVETDNKAAKEVRLVGNAERGAGKMFSVKLEDQQSKEINEVMIDVEPAEPQPQPAPVPIEEDPETEIDKIENSTSPNTPPKEAEVPNKEKPVIPIPKPKPPVPERPQVPEHPPIPEKRPEAKPDDLSATRPYLRDQVHAERFPRTAKMIADFNKNLEIPGVREWINTFRRRIPSGRRDYRSELLAFYKYANPFRGMMESVAQGYDVSSSFAYLTVIESAYFVGGKYVIQVPMRKGKLLSTALGPFQLLIDTAREVGVRVGGGKGDSRDERNYFAPSACGAAWYVAKRVDQFINRDTTIAILGYFQGGGRAAELTRRFRYNYAEVDRMAAIKKEYRDYVNKKLAIHFISRNMPKYGLSIPKDAPRSLPNNGTVLPPQEIKSEKCRGIFSAAS